MTSVNVELSSSCDIGYFMFIGERICLFCYVIKCYCNLFLDFLFFCRERYVLFQKISFLFKEGYLKYIKKPGIVFTDVPGIIFYRHWHYCSDFTSLIE